jgi:hypothetical protein
VASKGVDLARAVPLPSCCSHRVGRKLSGIRPLFGTPVFYACGARILSPTIFRGKGLAHVSPF